MDQLTDGEGTFDVMGFVGAQGIKHFDLSHEIIDYAFEIGLVNQKINLLGVIGTALKKFKEIGAKSQNLLQVVYEHQGTNEYIGTDAFEYEEIGFIYDVNYFLQYWFGNRQPESVMENEKYKCNSCEYKSFCSMWNVVNERIDRKPEENAQV